MHKQTHREFRDHSPKPGFLNPVPPVQPDVGPSVSAQAELSERLSRALAETYSLYLRTVGPIYCNLDKLTRQECEALIPAIDETAECIRSIGRPFPARFTTASEPDAEGADPAPPGQHDDGEVDAEESPIAVANFTRRLRAVLGIPTDTENAHSVDHRS